MKTLKIILIVVVLIILGLFLFKNTIAKFTVSKGVNFITGLKLDIEEMKVGIFNTSVDIQGMKLYNPPNFTENLMVDMPQIYVDYDLKSLVKGKIHLENLKIDLRELIVVKNQDGELNLNSLKVVKETKKEEPAEKKESQKREFQIDTLNLKIGKVIYKDYTNRETPSIREFNINIDKKYSNITDPYGLGSIIIVQALMNTTISSLANFDLGGLNDMASDTLDKTTEAIQKTTESATETAKDVTDETKKTIKKLIPFGN